MSSENEGAGQEPAMQGGFNLKGSSGSQRMHKGMGGTEGKKTSGGFHFNSGTFRTASMKSEDDEATNEAGADWRLVLTNLQREKKRYTARQEEQYVNRSLCCLDSSSRIREIFIKINESPLFNNFIIFAIITNCIFLLGEDPVCSCRSTKCTEAELYRRMLYAGKDCAYWSDWESILSGSEMFFMVLFTAEFVIKVVSRGFMLHRHAYLRDSWNWLDFVVVVSSIITAVDSENANLKVLRTVRVLRPLRTMTRIKGMRPVINTFINSIKNLTNVVSLLLFFFVVFGILGTDLLGGRLRGRCYIDPHGNSFAPGAYARFMSQQKPFAVESLETLWTRNSGIELCSQEEGTFVGASCDPAAVDGVLYNTTCSLKKWCLGDWCRDDWNDNPFSLGGGFMSYDNIGQAFLMIFQTLTNEAWVDLMYMYQDSYQMWGSRLYHVVWVIIGSFFVIQLALAVLADSFVQAQDDEKTEKEREALHNEAILRPIEVAVKVRTRGAFLSRLFGQPDGGILSPRTAGRSLVNRCVGDAVYQAVGRVRTLFRVMVKSKRFEQAIIFAILANTVIMMMDGHDQDLFEAEICRKRCMLDPGVPAGMHSLCDGPLFNRTFDSDGTGGGFRPRQVAFCFMNGDGDVEFEASSPYLGSACSARATEGECLGSPGVNGRGCYWFPDLQFGYQDPMRSTRGLCKMPLYTASNFAQNASVGGAGTSTISLRHLCGDDLSLCNTFDPAQRVVLDDINSVLTTVFIVEMVCKWIGLGFREYFADKFNQFDFVVVGASLVEIFAGLFASDGNSNSGTFSALRGARLFRLFKLARSWKDMRKILNTLAVALGSLWSLAIVWVMFMYMCALLGMQFFGGLFRFTKSDTPRSNFDSFWPSNLGHGALVIVFQIITTENWNTIMYNTMTTEGNASVGSSFYSVFCIGIVWFGNYIITNLFISILLQGFDSDEDADSELEDEAPKPKESYLKRIRGGFKVLLGQRGAAARVKDNSAHGSSNAEQAAEAARAEELRMMARNMATGQGEDEEDKGYFKVFYEPFGRHIKIPDHKAFFFLPRDNSVRVAIAAVTQHPFFDNAILIGIILTSITLAIEQPDWTIRASACPKPPMRLDCSGLEPGQFTLSECPRSATDDDWGKVFEPCDSTNLDMIPPCCGIADIVSNFAILDMVFTLIFLVEMLLKMVADGFVLHPKAYLRNPWNWIDCTVVVISMVSTFASNSDSNLKSFKALRSVRALRPLRVIQRNPSLKVVVLCLISSIPAMTSIGLVVLLWFSMFAMFGVQLFMGRFYRCYDPGNDLFYGAPLTPGGSLYSPTLPLGGEKAVPSIIECVDSGNNNGGNSVWVDKAFSFDTYLWGLKTLFEMATTEGWLEVMASTVDATNKGVSPLPNNEPAAGTLYCCFHIVVGAFVLLNLIVGSVINNYNRIKNLNDGIAPFLTPEQQEWKETRRIIMNLKPRSRQAGPENRIRNFCWRICSSPRFEIATTFVILLNVASLMTRTYNQPCIVNMSIFWCNVAFTFIFTMEAIIKLLGLGPRWYFLDYWNVFDLAVVILSITTIILDTQIGEHYCSPDKVEADRIFPGLQMLRVFRIARVFRLIRRLKGLRQMVETLIISLPSLGNIAALIILFMIIFGILGRTLFYNVGGLDSNANYATLDNAFMNLFRQTTGEAWNSIMDTCSQSDIYHACERAYGDYLNDGCGGPFVGTAFHFAWQIFGTYLMMQLFTAVILENFHELAKGEASVVPIEKLNEFVDTWAVFDPDARHEIPVVMLPDLVQKLSPPLGVNTKAASRCNLMQVIKDLAIPIRGGKVTYHETFVSCVKRVLDADVGEEEEPEEEYVKVRHL